MKWRERRGQTINLAVAAIVATLILALFLVMILASVKAHAATCLTVDLQPSDVVGNYDGDTYTIELGPLGKWNIREEGVNTPERNKKQLGWKEAKDFTEAWLHAGLFQLTTCFTFTFGRVLGSTSRNGVTLAEALRQAGHAR